MKSEKEQVEYLAALSKLSFGTAEAEDISRELFEMIEYMNILNELDTEGVEPLSHVFQIVNVMRDDEILDSLCRELVLANAPVSDNGAFVVPKAVE